MEKLTETIATFLGERRRFVTITGGGGKTTLLKKLGACYREKGFSVLMTTTTKFQAPEVYDWGVDSSTTELASLSPQKGTSTLFGKVFADGERWQSAPEEELALASSLFDVTLAEGDGSRHMPIKFHTQRDPVVVRESAVTIAIIGAWCLGKKASQVSFGDYGMDRVVDEAFLNGYIAHPEGLLKGNAELVVVNGFCALTENQKQVFRALDWKQLPVLLGNVEDDEMEEGLNL